MSFAFGIEFSHLCNAVKQARNIEKVFFQAGQSAACLRD